MLYAYFLYKKKFRKYDNISIRLREVKERAILLDVYFEDI
jgi:hypothetical protein